MMQQHLAREASRLHAALVFAELDAAHGSPRRWKAHRAQERAYRRWQRRAEALDRALEGRALRPSSALPGPNPALRGKR